MPKLMFYYKNKNCVFLGQAQFSLSGPWSQQAMWFNCTYGTSHRKVSTIEQIPKQAFYIQEIYHRSGLLQIKRKSLNKQNLCLICTDISCNPLLSAFFKMFTVCLCVWEPQGKSECNGFFIVQSQIHLTLFPFSRHQTALAFI